MVTGCGGRAGRTPRVAAAAVCAKRPRPAPQARARGPPNASAPACLVPAPPPRGRGLVAREAPACDPGHRGRGRGSSAEPAGVAQLTRQPAGNYLVGELPRIFPGCCQRFAMQPLSLTSSFLPLCLCSCSAFHLEALPFTIEVTLPRRPAQMPFSDAALPPS